MQLDKGLMAYLVCEVVIAIISVLGNALVVIVFVRDRRLRTPTNLYVFSLAVTDLLTSAVAMPLYVHSMMTQKPRDFHACLYVNTLILTFCTVSILHLIAVSFDRYMAVVWRRKPPSHGRGMRHATILITAAWILGGLIGCLPVMGWHSGAPDETLTAPRCEFMKVVRPSYLLFLFYATIITPTLIMIFFYASIYHTVRQHNDRMLSVHYSLDSRGSRAGQHSNDSSFKEHNKSLETDESGEERSTMVSPRMHNLQQRQSAKTKRVIFALVLVVVCFLVSWYPLYIMNAIAFYCTDCQMQIWWYYAPIILSHLSSAVNPMIYARTMPGYKEAFIEALACKTVSGITGEDECVPRGGSIRSQQNDRQDRKKESRRHQNDHDADSDAN